MTTTLKHMQEGEMVGEGTDLTPEQASAFAALKSFSLGHGDQSLALLAGNAGTGKTTVTSRLLRSLATDGWRVVAAAPTHKALTVLREKVGESRVEYRTIHSLLGLRLREREDGTQVCIREKNSTLHHFDLVVVDECSMISRELLRLIATLKQQARVLFVGDPAQLPPVGENGEPCVFGLIQNRIVLGEVVRQAAESPIIKLSMQVREWVAAKRMPGFSELWQSVQASGGIELAVKPGSVERIVSWAVHEWRSGRQCRVVAYRNRTVEALNSRIHARLWPGALLFAPGERVMVNEGFQVGDLNIQNAEELLVESVRKLGEVGGFEALELVLTRMNGGQITCQVAEDAAALQIRINSAFRDWMRLKCQARSLQQQGRMEDADKARRLAARSSKEGWRLKGAFAPIRHCYAITAHKSQGSTWDSAILHFEDLRAMEKDQGGEAAARALYVAVTRPRTFLAVVGS